MTFLNGAIPNIWLTCRTALYFSQRGGCGEEERRRGGRGGGGKEERYWSVGKTKGEG